jgi:phosphomannomutase
MSEKGKHLGELVAEMEKEYPCSGEINLTIKDGAAVIEKVKDKYEKTATRIDLTDGIGVEFDNWRFNLRPSNTEPLIRFNMETKGDRALLEEKKKEVMDFIHSVE